MRDEKEERKKQARSNKQTNKAKQHSTPKAVTFPRKNELPHTCICTFKNMYIHKKFDAFIYLASHSVINRPKINQLEGLCKV